MSRIFIKNSVRKLKKNIHISVTTGPGTRETRQEASPDKLLTSIPRGDGDVVTDNKTPPGGEGRIARDVVGRGGFEPPKASANRFTVCPR